MGYTIYGKCLKFKREVIQSGDTVKVISTDIIKSKEIRNWLEEEGANVSIGDKFIVHFVTKNAMGLWIALDGLNFNHPIEKFIKVRGGK